MKIIFSLTFLSWIFTLTLSQVCFLVLNLWRWGQNYHHHHSSRGSGDHGGYMSWFRLWCPFARFDTYTSASQTNIYLCPTQHPTTRDPSSDLCHHITHLLSIVINSRHHGDLFRTYLPICIGYSYTAYPLVLRYTYLSTCHWLITILMYYLLLRTIPIGR